MLVSSRLLSGAEMPRHTPHRRPARSGTRPHSRNPRRQSPTRAGCRARDLSCDARVERLPPGPRGALPPPLGLSFPPLRSSRTVIVDVFLRCGMSFPRPQRRPDGAAVASEPQASVAERRKPALLRCAVGFSGAWRETTDSFANLIVIRIRLPCPAPANGAQRAAAVGPGSPSGHYVEPPAAAFLPPAARREFRKSHLAPPLCFLRCSSSFPGRDLVRWHVTRHDQWRAPPPRVF